MRIAVIGRGNIGGTLGRRWTEAGHDVAFGSREPAGSIEEAVAGAEVVLLAVPGAAAKELVATLGGSLAGKVVVDATNDVQGSGELHALGGLPAGAHAVRAFNTLGWESFDDPVVAGQQASLFFAAAEGPGKDAAEQLIGDVGLEPVWVGGVDRFDLVDSLTRLWFTLVFERGHPRRTALKVLTPGG